LNIRNKVLVNLDYTKAIARIVSTVTPYRETPGLMQDCVISMPRAVLQQALERSRDT
jgi:hypothetical protein